MTKRVRFEYDFREVFIEEPLWFNKQRGKTMFCQGKNCFRFLDLPCRTCKYDSKPYASYMETFDPFMNIILSLKRWGLPNDLCKLITTDYVQIHCLFKLKCPYVLKGKKAYHLHCVKPFKSSKIHMIAEGDMRLKVQIKDSVKCCFNLFYI